ncbi:MAG TPA: hypothetical protein VFG95_09320 [Nitrospiria bacterium]|nr:hypothetical protein [Nitrospiria bacterium]
MNAKIEAVWALRVAPDDEAEDLHEFGLAWYRFTNDPTLVDPVIKSPARPAVWVRFGRVEHLERMQRSYPDAKLGPSSRFTEGLIFAENWDRARALVSEVASRLKGADEDDSMGQAIREDTLEDY